MPPATAIALFLAQLVLCGCVPPAESGDVGARPRRVLHQPLFPIEWTPPPSPPPPPAPDFTSDPSPPASTTPDAPPSGDFFPPAPPAARGSGGTTATSPTTIAADVSNPPSGRRARGSMRRDVERGERVQPADYYHRLPAQPSQHDQRLLPPCRRAAPAACRSIPPHAHAPAHALLHRLCPRRQAGDLAVTAAAAALQPSSTATSSSPAAASSSAGKVSNGPQTAAASTAATNDVE